MNSEQENVKGRFIVFDFTVSAVATVLNAVVLIGVVRARLSLKGYKAFLISLCVGDLCASLINIGSYSVQVAQVPTVSAELSPKNCWVHFFRSLQVVCFATNLTTLCGMSIDHVIGILHPLRYGRIMKRKNINSAIISIWLLSFIFGFCDYPLSWLMSALASEFPTNEMRSKVNESFFSNCSDSFNGDNSRIPEDVVAIVLNKLMENSSLSSVDLYIPDWDEAMTSTEPTTSTDPNNLLEDTLSFYSTPFANQFFNTSNGPLTCQLEKALKEIYDLDNINPKDVRMDDECFLSSSSSTFWLEGAVMVFAAVCFVFLIACYGTIFFEVYIARQIPQKSARRLVVTTFLLLSAFTLLWMPIVCFEITMITIARNQQTNFTQLLVVHTVLNSLMFSYPLVDPIIYAARLASVRRAIFLILKENLPAFIKVDRGSRMSSSQLSQLNYGPSMITPRITAFTPRRSWCASLPSIDADCYPADDLRMINSDSIENRAISISMNGSYCNSNEESSPRKSLLDNKPVINSVLY